MNKIILLAFTLIIMLMGCRSSDDDCIDTTKINEEAVCTADYSPVCGCDGTTYSNACNAENAGVTNWTAGTCPE